jgi:hypothetical protein
LASAVTVAAIGVPSIVKCTMVLGSPEPVSAGSEVILSVLDIAVSWASASVTAGGGFETSRNSVPWSIWTTVPTC